MPNWFEEANTFTIDRNTAPNSVYTIVPIEQSSGGIQALRIPRDISPTGTVTSFYYLEFRQPFGFDHLLVGTPSVNGITIRLAPDYSGTIERSRLIDTTPETTGSVDEPLAVGKTFTDPYKDINITTLSVSPEGAQVRVFFGSPITLPVITLSSPNGGEQWAKGSTQNIVWQTINGVGGETYDLTLRSSDGKLTYPVALQAVTGQSYAWSVGWRADQLALVPDGQYSVRVCLSGNDQVRCANSRGPFTIYTPGGGSPNPKGGGTLPQPEALPDRDLTASVSLFFHNLFPVFFGR